jgi:hypothetical protein
MIDLILFSGAGKEPEEWHCDGCGCPQTATPPLRKGPNGEKVFDFIF